MTDIFNIAIRDFLRTSIGFSKAFEAFEYGPFREELLESYPHYNIRDIDHKTNVIELAVAGFTEKDVEVKYANNTLSIVGDKEEKETDSFLHHGIANRSFTRTFNVADDVIVKGGSLKDGILSISLERIIPEEKKERIIKLAS